MIYNEVNEYIISNEERLRKRHIMKITDDNWWIWGRDFYKSNSSRIYVNSKTRNKNPFFINDCTSIQTYFISIFVFGQAKQIPALAKMQLSVHLL